MNIREVKSCVVRIQSEIYEKIPSTSLYRGDAVRVTSNSNSTAFFIDFPSKKDRTQRLLFTCRHSVLDNQKTSLWLRKDVTSEAVCVPFSATWNYYPGSIFDIACCLATNVEQSLRDSAYSISSFRAFTMEDFYYGELVANSKLAYAGFPSGLGNYNDGIASAFYGEHSIFKDNHPLPDYNIASIATGIGASGSPVLHVASDGTCNLVGLLAKGTQENQALCFYVPLDFVIQLAKSACS